MAGGERQREFVSIPNAAAIRPTRARHAAIFDQPQEERCADAKKRGGLVHRKADRIAGTNNQGPFHNLAQFFVKIVSDFGVVHADKATRHFISPPQHLIRAFRRVFVVAGDFSLAFDMFTRFEMPAANHDRYFSSFSNVTLIDFILFFRFPDPFLVSAEGQIESINCPNNVLRPFTTPACFRDIHRIERTTFIEAYGFHWGIGGQTAPGDAVTPKSACFASACHDKPLSK